MQEKKLIKYSDILSDLGKTQHVATVIEPVRNRDYWEFRIEFRRGNSYDPHVDKVYKTVNYADAQEAKRAENYFWDDPKIPSDNEIIYLGAVLSEEDLLEKEEKEE